MGPGGADLGSREATGAAQASTRFSPWRHVGENHSDWIIEIDDLGGVREAMCVRDRVILLDRSRTTRERRCDLAHAVAHIELGHRDRRNKSDERAAVRYAAKMLIDLEDLAAALESTAGVVNDDAADLLDVDLETLSARLEHVHPAERGYLRRRLAALGDAAA